MSSHDPAPDQEANDLKAQDRAWLTWATCAVVGVLLFGALFAFLVQPYFQRDNARIDLWTAMCRAVGIAPGSPAYPQPQTPAPGAPVSQVQWGPEVLQILAQAEPARGARIAAETCVACHGEKGVSATPELPSLNGQTAAAIYKQLHDYRSGARAHPLMTPIAQQLAVVDLANVAAYFGTDAQPGAGLGTRDQPGDPAIVRLAREGDSARRIPSCNSCHVNGSGGPIETPILTGQDHGYLAVQLRAFRAGERKNDVYQRMRAIAGHLSDSEIEALSRYYQGVL